MQMGHTHTGDFNAMVSPVATTVALWELGFQWNWVHHIMLKLMLTNHCYNLETPLQQYLPTATEILVVFHDGTPGSAFIKPDQLDPGIKDEIKITLLPKISHLQLLNFVSCGRACPSHMTQNLVTVGAKLWTAESFLFDPWSVDQADLVG